MTREEWAEGQDYCWVCGWRAGEYRTGKWKLETHEIARGPARAAAMDCPAAWVRTCNVCHTYELDDLKRWPIARQLALKKKHDPEHYNRVAVNVLRHRDPEAITEAEVEREVV